MSRSSRYPQELRERAVRMVFDHQSDYSSHWKAIESIAKQLDVHKQTFRVGFAVSRSTTVFGRV